MYFTVTTEEIEAVINFIKKHLFKAVKESEIEYDELWLIMSACQEMVAEINERKSNAKA